MRFAELIKKLKQKRKAVIVETSNIIQYDTMGNPLRLCIGSDKRQRWVDTHEREDDAILEWRKKNEPQTSR